MGKFFEKLAAFVVHLKKYFDFWDFL